MGDTSILEGKRKIKMNKEKINFYIGIFAFPNWNINKGVLNMGNKLFTLLLLILAFPGIASATFYGGHEYEPTSSGLLWTEAEQAAVAWCGHLVTINNQAEQNWLTATYGVPIL